MIPRHRYRGGLVVVASVVAAALACGGRDRDGAEHTAVTQVVSLSPRSLDVTDRQQPLDCVGILQVRGLRGRSVANARRFSDGGVRSTHRVRDLSEGELAAFCDWRACITANGYGHVCYLNDAGWERCRPCDGASDCGGGSPNQSECVARVRDDAYAQCHVGLLVECLLQRAIRGPADARSTTACQLSDSACAGTLQGDLSGEVSQAQTETEQIAVDECRDELAQASVLDPDAAAITLWESRLDAWDASSGVEGGWDGPAVDASVE
jgi:hypothetical protein